MIQKSFIKRRNYCFANTQKDYGNMPSAPKCPQRGLVSAGIFLLLLSTCSGFGIQTRKVNLGTCLNRKQMTYMTMTSVEDSTTTTGETSARNTNFKGSQYLNMNSESREEQSNEIKKQQRENTDETDEPGEGHMDDGNASTLDDSECDDDVERRRKELVKAGFLGRGGAVSRSKHPSKGTSVGARRVGSATRARQNPIAVTKVANTLRKTASAKSKTKPDSSSKNGENQEVSTGSFSSFSIQSLTRSAIIHAVEETFFESNSKLSKIPSGGSNLTAGHFMPEYERPMGILGQENEIQSVSRGIPGYVVLPPSTNDTLLVRIATPADDPQIAALRLSVFSDFSPAQQGHFCKRSCQAISSRRLRGACCLVAAKEHNDEKVLGTAECSYHEFYGTRLGQRRPQYSILYVTEVAVNSEVRGQGIGKKLMSAVEIYASSLGIETIYLHVDVENEAALALYEKAGYECVNGEEDSMYLEFTTSLHLHPGATKGRSHYLMFKNLVPEPVWLESNESKLGQEVKAMGTLGFDISV